eukprot:SAG31_NODE_1793_length_7241_cov_2.075611_4_plen_50_part_00
MCSTEIDEYVPAYTAAVRTLEYGRVHPEIFGRLNLNLVLNLVPVPDRCH